MLARIIVMIISVMSVVAKLDDLCDTIQDCHDKGDGTEYLCCAKVWTHPDDGELTQFCLS